jgi:hypothetical protein
VNAPDPWPLLMGLHAARIRPESEPVRCPKCADELEPLWTPGQGNAEPPLVCPSCLTLEPTKERKETDDE